MLEDQLSDQVGFYRSLSHDQNAGRGAPVPRRPHSEPWFVGSSMNSVDHSVDLQASRTKFGSQSGFQGYFLSNLAALAAKLLISTSNTIWQFELGGALP